MISAIRAHAEEVSGTSRAVLAAALDVTEWVLRHELPADSRSLLTRLGEAAGVTFCLENLNTAVDHPGVPFARAADTRALVAAVGSPALRMMLDVYHAQIGEGNLVELIRSCGDLIGEVQVADVPGRCEPGTGEISYPAVARALADVGYTGTVGLEAFASGDSELALSRFRAAFSLD